MKLDLFQVDAFTERPLAGNPAAVVPLDGWLPDVTLQAIARENNLSETAYFVRKGAAYHLRWFTPGTEVDLCGHATLASAWVLFERLGYSGTEIAFETLSGTLTVRREGRLLAMTLPAWMPEPAEPHPDLLPALGGTPTAVLKARDYVVIYGTAAEVRRLAPDFGRLKRIDRMGVAVTSSPADRPRIIASAPGDEDYDMVSRYFASPIGIDEDPVTGRAHCQLTPYWARRLGKTELRAWQASARGGEVICRLHGNKVDLLGACALYLEGRITL